MIRSPIVFVVVGLLTLSCLVELTSGCIVGAARLFVETTAEMARGVGVSVAELIGIPVNDTPDWTYQEALAEAAKAKSASTPVNLNVQLTVDSTQVTQAKASVITEPPSGSQPTATQVQ
jgi:hypothetical protein